MYWNVTDKERLIKAFLYADNPQLLEKFLKDILSDEEIKTCEMRLKAMCLLHDLASYSTVQSLMRLSPNTVAHLAKKVNNKEGGFRKIINKFKKNGPAYSE